jgi:DNA-binding GntR family transcriptional regulator
MADLTSQAAAGAAGGASRLWALDSTRGSKAEQIVESLRAAIVTLRLEPGAMLSEQDVAARFEVSRQPVREAFIRLARSGLVEIRPQRGTFVGRISRDTIADAHFVREAVETQIAGLAARRARPADLAALEREMRLQRQAGRARDAVAFFALDETFHRLLAAIAGRPNAWRVIEEAKAQLDRVRYLTLLEAKPLAERIAQHEAIVSAIAAKRPAAASAAMKVHLSGLMRALPRLAEEWPQLFEPG